MDRQLRQYQAVPGQLLSWMAMGSASCHHWSRALKTSSPPNKPSPCHCIIQSTTMCLVLLGAGETAENKTQCSWVTLLMNGDRKTAG